jgi:hypothetical protein
MFDQTAVDICLCKRFIGRLALNEQSLAAEFLDLRQRQHSLHCDL